MLAGQKILEIEHSIYIHGMGQSMLEAPKQLAVRRTTRQLQNDKITIDGRITRLYGSTQNRDTNPTPPRQMEAETLKEAANSDIAYWLEHNRISRQCGVSNILMSLGQPAESEQANRSFLAKILRSKRTAIQDGRTDDGMNDPAERNEEPPD